MSCWSRSLTTFKNHRRKNTFNCYKVSECPMVWLPGMLPSLRVVINCREMYPFICPMLCIHNDILGYVVWGKCAQMDIRPTICGLQIIKIEHDHDLFHFISILVKEIDLSNSLPMNFFSLSYIQRSFITTAAANHMLIWMVYDDILWLTRVWLINSKMFEEIPIKWNSHLFIIM